MQYYVQSGNDGSFIEQCLDPAHLKQVLVAGDSVFDTMRTMQKMTDSNAKIINGQRMAGYSPDKERGLKVIARMPESVLIALLAVEPDLLKDKKTFDRILKKYPIYRAYSTGAAG